MGLDEVDDEALVVGPELLGEADAKLVVAVVDAYALEDVGAHLEANHELLLGLVEVSAHGVDVGHGEAA